MSAMENKTNVIQRIDEMLSESDKFHEEWDTCDLQYEANTYEDVYGNLHVNTPLEQNLIEMDLGRTAGLPLFDVQPDWYRADIQKLETAKYVLNYFLDKEKRYREYRLWKMNKAKYWTAIFFTGISIDIEIVPEYWDAVHDDNYTAFFDHKSTVDKTKVNRSFTPKDVPVRLFLFDESAMRQSDFSKVEDCVMMEIISKKKLLQRYEDNKYFDRDQLDSLTEWMTWVTEYGIESTKPVIILYHYFNKITKEYAIRANKKEELFEWKLLYPDGKLPFTLCQHYPNNACMYWIGICRKVRTEKAYTNNMRQYILDGAKIWSGKILALWNSWEPLDGDLMVNPWGMTIARFTNSVSDIREINTNVDLNWPLAVLDQLEKQTRANTGIDINAVFEPPADQLGTVEIIEENKQIRNKSTDELLDFAIDDALTKLLNNIAEFAPRLLKSTVQIKNKKWKVIKTTYEYPKLQLPNVKIVKNKKNTYIEKSMWEYGYLDFTPETLQGWLCVRVVTWTTANTKMKIIEKNKTNEFISKYVELAQVLWAEALEEKFPIDQVLEKRKISYEMDDKKLVADTTKDIIRKKNEEKLALLQELITNAQTPSAPTPQGGSQTVEWPEPEAPTTIWDTTENAPVTNEWDEYIQDSLWSV